MDNKIAIVTGAGAGLGRAYALDLAANGCRVLVNDMNAEAAHALTQEINALHKGFAKQPRAIANVAPVSTNFETCKTEIVDFCVQAFGGEAPSILVNNAGILRDATFAKQTEAQWQQVIDIHLTAVRNLCKACWPLMRKQRYGKIVNVSSTSGFGNFGQSNYSCAKAGIFGFTKTLSREGASSGVLVNAIVPSAYTAMTASVAGLREMIEKRAKPEMVAPVVTWLCHPQCALTGKIVEAGCGYVSEIRFLRAKGKFFDIGGKGLDSTSSGEACDIPTPYSWKDVAAAYSSEISRDFLSGCTNPEDYHECGLPVPLAQAAVPFSKL